MLRYLSNAPRRVQVLIALVLVCVLAYLPPFIGLLFGAWPFDEDALGFFEICWAFSKQTVSQGTLPLWNPHLFCGLPFISDGQTSLFYPPDVIYWLLPVRPAMLADAMLHNLWLMAGTYVLGRVLGLSRTASFVSAIALGLGGAVSAHIYTGHMTWHVARSYLPWELAALLLYLRSGERRYLIRLAVLFSLQMLSGYPPFVLLGVGLCCGLLTAWCVQQGRRRRQGAPQHRILPHNWLQAALICGALCATLSAVVVLPLIETSRASVHGTSLSYSETVSLSASWRSLVRLLLPGFFGGNRDIQWSAPYSAHEEAAYIGGLALVLAIGAPFFARRRVSDGGERRQLPSAVPWLWALWPVSAVLALGGNTPLYHWLYDHCALFRMTRAPVRWLEVWCLAGALLAGFSFDGYLDSRRRDEPHPTRVLLIVLYLLAACCLALALALLLMTTPHSALWMQTPQWNRAPDAAGQLAVAAELRRTAVLEALTASILMGLAASLLDRWQKAIKLPGLLGQQRVKLLLVALMTLDMMNLFWQSSRVVPASQMKESVLWPPALTRNFKTGQRWDTSGLRLQALNRGTLENIDLFNGYESLTSARYFNFARALDKDHIWGSFYEPAHRSSLLRVAGVTHTISARGSAHHSRNSGAAPGTASSQAIARARDWTLWKYRYAVQTRDGKRRWENAWPRLYVTRHTVPTPEAQQLVALQRLSKLPFESTGRPAVVAAGAFANIPDLAVTPDDKVLHWQWELNSMCAEVVARHPSIVVESEAFYPGWRAWVNGQPATLQPVNFLFRGVAVPAGKSWIQVVYDNQTYRFALFVSLCGLAALTALGTQRIRLSPSVRKQTEYCPGADQQGGVEAQRQKQDE